MIPLSLFLNLGLKCFLVLLLGGVVILILRRHSASIRHWTWSLIFVFLLALPFLSLVLPKKNIRLMQTYKKPVTVTEFRTSPSGPLSVSSPAPASFDGKKSFSPTSGKAITSASYLSMIPFFLWLIVALFLLARFLNHLSGLRRILKQGEPVLDAGIQSLLAGCCSLLKIRITPSVFSHYKIPYPAACGIRHPVIFLPPEIRHWPVSRQKTILMHELAHIKRYDHLTNCLVQFVCALYWFIPLIWLAKKCYGIERERACDDFVLNQGTQKIDYARHLLDIAHNFSAGGLRHPFTASMARQSDLKTRLKHILSSETKHKPPSQKKFLISAFFICLSILPFSMAEFSSRAIPSAISNADNLNFASLLMDLESTNPEIQKKAAWNLGEKEDWNAVPALVDRLDDKNPEVRGLAAWALGEIKDKGTLKYLAKMVSDSDPYAREMAVRALGELEDKTAAPFLFKALGDSNTHVRCAAVWALGEISSTLACRAVESCGRDEDARVRRMCVYILLTRPSLKNIPHLIPFLSDADEEVRILTVRALGETRRKEIFKPLIQSLKDPSSKVRGHTARSLGMLGDARAVDSLLVLLRDSEPEVRDSAIWALDEINLN
jgi:HEAT repeat protein/beta-lactamase regulating signal transducer with metallopeptidase domain